MVFGNSLIATGQNPRLSISIKRRIGLLQVVLPAFSDPIAKKNISAKKFSVERAFWTKLATSCLLIESADWQFQKLDEQHEDIVKRVLEGLEALVEENKIDTEVIRWQIDQAFY